MKVLTSHMAAREDFQQVIGNEDPHGRRGARWLSQVELLQVGSIPKMVQEKRIQREEVEH